MPDDELVAFCPNCGERTAKKHCGKDATTCDWMRCANSECNAVIDPKRGTGFRPRQAGESPAMDPKIGSISHLPWKADA